MIGANQRRPFFGQEVEACLFDTEHHFAAEPSEILHSTVSPDLKPCQGAGAGCWFGFIHDVWDSKRDVIDLIQFVPGRLRSLPLVLSPR